MSPSPDVYGSCAEKVCAPSPLEGYPRRLWFRIGDHACVHVLSHHSPHCPIPRGGSDMDVCDALCTP